MRIGDRVRDLNTHPSFRTGSAIGTVIDTARGRLMVTCNRCSSPYLDAPGPSSCASCGGTGFRPFYEMERSVRLAGEIVAVRWDKTRAPCAVYANSVGVVSAVDRLAELAP